MKYTVVLPYVDHKYAIDCIASLKLENVLKIDNCFENKGIMRSHNLGIDKMHSDNADWLIILSAAIIFGPPGGLDFIAEIEKRPNDIVVEAAGVYGWHLIAFSRRVIDRVGKWDENFTPYGYDDLDYSWRIQRAFQLDPVHQIWEKVPVNLRDRGMAHSIHIGNIKTQKDEELRKYFIKKWGAVPIPIYTHPFNEEKNDISYWPSIAL